MEKERPKAENFPDRFPEVTMAYRGLRNTVNFCRDCYRDRIISEGYGEALDNSFRSVIRKNRNISGMYNERYIDNEDLRLNIPNMPYPMGKYFPFRSVTFKYDNIVGHLEKKFKINDKFTEDLTEYRAIRGELNAFSQKIKSFEGERIRDRYFNIIKCIQQTPNGFYLVPEKICCDEEEVIKALREQGQDIYFFAKAGLLKRVGLKKGLRPDFKKTKDAQISDWFEIGKDMSFNLTEKLSHCGWERPLFFRVA